MKGLVHWRRLEELINHFFLLLVELVQRSYHGLVRLKLMGFESIDWCTLFALSSLLQFCIGKHRPATKVLDLTKLLAGCIAVCIPILQVVLVVAPVHGEMLVAATPLLMSLSLVLVDLLSNGMSNRQHELRSKSQV